MQNFQLVTAPFQLKEGNNKYMLAVHHDFKCNSHLWLKAHLSSQYKFTKRFDTMIFDVGEAPVTTPFKCVNSGL